MKMLNKIVAGIMLVVALVAFVLAVQRTLMTEHEGHTTEFTWNGKPL